MKIILVLLFIGAVFSANKEHSYTMGQSPYYVNSGDYLPLNYRGEGTVDVDIMYTSNKLASVTNWCVEDNCGWEAGFDSFYDGENKNLYLQFEIPSMANTPWTADADDGDENRCLVCMNVDENSELKDGDTGFAVCYNTKKGNFFTYSATTPYPMNTKDPQFLFMGTVKATNKGTAVKATKKNGWLSSFQWNKHANADPANALCPSDASAGEYSGDFHYMFAYHDSMWWGTTDLIGIVSEDGFKNTGLKNGENHLKCWVRGSGTNGEFEQTSLYNDKWTPDFEADEG